MDQKTGSQHQGELLFFKTGMEVNLREGVGFELGKPARSGPQNAVKVTYGYVCGNIRI